MLDIGAGHGVITEALLTAGARVIAVELHPDRVHVLRARFGDTAVVVRADAADLRLPRRPYHVVANPPFGATAALLRRLLQPGSRLASAHLVLQEQAAVRWCGPSVAVDVRAVARPTRTSHGVQSASARVGPRAARAPHRSTLRRRMVLGMASQKITVTLPVGQVDQVRALVEAGQAASVSGFVAHAVGVALDDVAGWGAMLAEALDATGGKVSADEKVWADEVLGVGKRRRGRAA